MYSSRIHPGAKKQSILTILLIMPAIVAAIIPCMDDVLAADKKQPLPESQISPMGAMARGDVPRLYYKDFLNKAIGPLHVPFSPLGLQGDERLVHSPTAVGFQSENTIAVNGPYVVVGFNDIRGFGATVSVSGYAYSNDGGVSWMDGGQLPLLDGTDLVYGDPDVKTWTDPVNSDIYFFYSSIYVTSGGLSSLCLHVSTDGGATWSNPREVISATSASDFSDKEFMGVDPETGRIFISWTNFGASTTMRITYSDDFGLTWSPATSFASSGQGSIPRADPGSDNVYLAWRSGSSIKFVVSTNNGGAWSSIFDAATGLVNPESPYGSDRIHGFPSMDVDGATGDAYIVYASQNIANDFSDVYLFKAFYPGTTYTAPVAINSNPGFDRAQFFSWVCVDQGTGRISVVWYDQINGTGTSDITDVFHTHSDDEGLTWACPAPLTDKPFHAEYGNNTSQPNIGDYIQCVSQNNLLYTAFAKTDEPSHLTYAPDTYVDISDELPQAAPIGFRDVTITDNGCSSDNGWIEPGEDVHLDFTLWDFTDACGTIGGIQGTLTSLTPLVTVIQNNSVFGDLAGAGAVTGNVDSLSIHVDTTFTCGDAIDLNLAVTSSVGNASIPIRLSTGIPISTLLLAEEFDTVSAPVLPSGWATSTISGTVNPWVTSTTFSASSPNAVYCADIGSVSLNRLESPVINVPADCAILQISFEITHNLEDDGAGTRMAWDGALLKVLIGGSQTALAGSFASLFDQFYPDQLYRMSGTGANPLQDLAVWSGDETPNFSDVLLEFTSLAGQQIQFLWEVGTDGAVGTSSGMFVDNVMVSSVSHACSDCILTAVAGNSPQLPFRILGVIPNPFNPSTTVRFTLPERMNVTSQVWSVAGERIRALANNRLYEAGESSLRWDGKNDDGELVASGVYFIRLKTRLGSRVARAVLLK